jgi:hypothetical protein
LTIRPCSTSASLGPRPIASNGELLDRRSVEFGVYHRRWRALAGIVGSGRAVEPVPTTFPCTTSSRILSGLRGCSLTGTRTKAGRSRCQTSCLLETRRQAGSERAADRVRRHTDLTAMSRWGRGVGRGAHSPRPRIHHGSGCQTTAPAPLTRAHGPGCSVGARTHRNRNGPRQTGHPSEPRAARTSRYSPALDATTCTPTEPTRACLRIRRLGVRVPSGARHQETVDLRKRRSTASLHLSTVDLLCSESDPLFRKRPDRSAMVGAALCRLVFDLGWCPRWWIGAERHGAGI